MSSTKRASMAAFSASVAVAFFICRSPAPSTVIVIIVVVVVVSVDPPWWRRLESRISGDRRAYLLMAAEAHGASLVSWVI
jgi:hypothetical protein